MPPPATAPPPQSFPPANVGQRLAWPDRLAIAPDGKRLLVPLNLADAAAIVDIDSKRVRYVPTGNYPYGAAILAGGETGLVSNETPGTVSVIDLDKGTKVNDIQVGPPLSHPEAIAVDPKAERAYVAIANSRTPRRRSTGTSGRARRRPPTTSTRTGFRTTGAAGAPTTSGSTR